MTAGRIAIVDVDRDRVRLAAAVGVASSAWGVTLVLEAAGMAGSLHHDALLEGGPPLPVATGLFIVSWVVMLAAMMVPASLAVIARSGSPAWVVGFVLIWTGVGLAGFAGDGVLHRVVDAWPWLANHAWIIESIALAAAGAYQFTPVKRRTLDRCRAAAHASPGSAGSEHASAPGGSFAAGWRHGLDCVGSSGALMVLLFAVGVASLVPMVVLTALMAYEAHGRAGPTAARVAGLALILLAVNAMAGASPLVA